jgi:hypothetical protein
VTLRADDKRAASATLRPFFEGGSPPGRSDYDGYLPVRVSEAPRPNGSILVYLPNGTALVVDNRYLLRLDGDKSSAT